MNVSSIKSIFILFLIGILLHMNCYSQIKEIIQEETDKQLIHSMELCKYLHQNPELSMHEFETAKLMANELQKDGFEVTTDFGGNNVVGVLKNGAGPVVMIRCDMDALPIQEKTDFEFASIKKATDQNGQEVSIMHACGHDIHMSVWTGTIHTLTALKKYWQGTLLVIAQEAEELGKGAKAAIDTGLFQKFPIPDYALALHIMPELEAGVFGINSGPVFAGIKTANITVFGEGGHGAYPHNCIDPIVIASRIVLDLQTIVSREISPFEPIVVTVGSIHGGTRPNIIPDEVKMELTLRYYNEHAIDHTVVAIKRICKGAAIMAGLDEEKYPKVEFSGGHPPVINDEKLSLTLKRFTSSVIGEKNTVTNQPAMGGEDFGLFGRTPENIPICMMRLGVTNPELMKELKINGKNPYPLHSPHLNPDYEKAIETGIKTMTANVIGLMPK